MALRKVRVPQVDGEIVFSRGGDPDDVRRFVVQDHIVSPRSIDEQTELLALVDGSRLATAKEVDAPPTVTDDAAAGSDAKPKE